MSCMIKNIYNGAVIKVRIPGEESSEFPFAADLHDVCEVLWHHFHVFIMVEWNRHILDCVP